jgi:hypothetical protein
LTSGWFVHLRNPSSAAGPGERFAEHKEMQRQENRQRKPRDSMDSECPITRVPARTASRWGGSLNPSSHGLLQPMVTAYTPRNPVVSSSNAKATAATSTRGGAHPKLRREPCARRSAHGWRRRARIPHKKDPGDAAAGAFQDLRRSEPATHRNDHRHQMDDHANREHRSARPLRQP